MEPNKTADTEKDPTDYINISDLRHGVERSLRGLHASTTSAGKATSGLERVTRGHTPAAEEIKAIHPYLDGIIAALSQPEFRGKLVDLLSAAEDALVSKDVDMDSTTSPIIKKTSEPKAADNKETDKKQQKEALEEGPLTALLSPMASKLAGALRLPKSGPLMLAINTILKGKNVSNDATMRPLLDMVVKILTNPATRSMFFALIKKVNSAEDTATTPATSATPPPVPAPKSSASGAQPKSGTTAPPPSAGTNPNVNAPAPPANTPLRSSMYEDKYNPEDTATINMPLLLRLMEFAKEDAETDMDLHRVIENIVQASEHGDTLTMDHYDDIVSEVSDDSHKDLGEGWWDEDGPDYGDDDDFNHRRFARRGSALHAADDDNPRTLPCPTCGCPNRLTRLDQMRGYQCDSCADAIERGGEIRYCDDHDHDMSENMLESITECGAWGDQGGEEVHNSYNVTKTTTSKGATVTVTANATEMSELQRIMKLAGLNQDLVTPVADQPEPAPEYEPAVSEPLGVIKSQEIVPVQIQPEFDAEPDMGSDSYSTNAHTLKSMLVNKMRNKLSY